MSALYGLALIVTWLGLTAWFWKIWRRWRAQPDANRRTVDAAGILFLLLWVGVSFWYGGGRMYFYDAQVNRLCAIDGGVKVYETVKLPANRFEKGGMVNFYRPTQNENALGPEYEFKYEITYYRQGNPDMFRMHTQIIRRADGKLLGESVFYKRGGGDLPGPWHGSSYMCPELSVANDVLRQVFIRE